LLEEVSLHRGGGDAVDQNALVGQLLAEGFGEANDPGLGGAVGRSLRIAFFTGNGGDIDNPARSIYPTL